MGMLQHVTPECHAREWWMHSVFVCGKYFMQVECLFVKKK